MALTRREYQDALRTLNRSGSKAPLQNVKLPTNQSNYRTPGRTTTTTSAAQGGQPTANAQDIARIGGLLGKMGKYGYGQYKAMMDKKDVLGGLADAEFASPELSWEKELLLQDNVDNVLGVDSPMGVDLPDGLNRSTDLAGPTEAASNLSDVAQTADATKNVGDVAAAGEMANAAGTSADVAANSADVLGGLADANQGVVEGAATTGSSVPGLGTAVGIGADLAQGNTGSAAMRAGGAALGGMIAGPMGIGIGSTLGGLLGRFF